MKYLISVFSVIYLPKTLIWNKIAFCGSNSLKLAELVLNKLKKDNLQKYLPVLISTSNLSLLNAKGLRASN